MVNREASITEFTVDSSTAAIRWDLNEPSTIRETTFGFLARYLSTERLSQSTQSDLVKTLRDKLGNSLERQTSSGVLWYFLDTSSTWLREGQTEQTQLTSPEVIAFPIQLDRDVLDDNVGRYLFAKDIGLNSLGVPFQIEEGVLQLTDSPTTKAAHIITSILTRKIAEGLPVMRINVKRLSDREADQWVEIIFTVHVNLDSKEANRQWDQIIDEVTEIQQGMDDIFELQVKHALLERIGIHFAWLI